MQLDDIKVGMLSYQEAKPLMADKPKYRHYIVLITAIDPKWRKFVCMEPTLREAHEQARYILDELWCTDVPDEDLEFYYIKRKGA